MMVSGAVQLVAAPIAAFLETRIDPRLLTAIGYAMFGSACLPTASRPATDFDDLILPQVLRGRGDVVHFARHAPCA